MHARDRLFATLTIWAAFVVTSSVVFVQTTTHPANRLREWTLIVIILVIALAAAVSTFAVWWHWPRERECEKQHRAQQRVARLAEQPDEAVDPHEAETLITSRKNRTDE